MLRTQPRPIPPVRRAALSVPERTTLHAGTDDGVVLAIDRYARPGAPPVLLLHGWLQSPRGMDSDVPGHSIARHLSASGFDVFVGCFRGAGRGRTRSGSRGGSWSPAQKAAHDLPAMISAIRRRTGATPSLVGHSLGGLVALLYMAGAALDPETGEIRPSARHAARRNARVPRVAAIAPPLAHPDRAIAVLSERPDVLGRLLCRVGASRLGGRLLEGVGRVPLGAALKALGRAPKVGRRLRGAVLHVACHDSLRSAWRPENMSAEIIAAELEHTLDATSGPELRQLARWVSNGGLFESDGADWRPALASVRVPTLLVAGTHDGMSPLEGVVGAGRTLLSAAPLDLLIVEDAGHNDLRVGDKAAREVYPALADWLTSAAKRRYSVSR